MQIIISARELASSSKLQLTFARALPRCGEARNMIEMIEKEMGPVFSFLDTPIEERQGLMVAAELNEILAGMETGIATIRWISPKDHELSLMINFCEEKLIEINEVLEENVGTLVGIGITIYGLMRTFGGTLKTMGNRIVKILN